MKATKDAVEAAFRTWNEISSTLDAKPTTFDTIEEFEPFYERLLSTLMEEEATQ